MWERKAILSVVSAPVGPLTHLGASSITGGGQRQNRFYSFYVHQDKKDSPNMVTGTLRVFHFDVYAFLDLRDTLSFLTHYIAVNFDIRQETF